jgi:nucleotide sugar dehydrogenase
MKGDSSIMLLKKIQKRTAKICIVGLGYVGLPTAIHFSEKGFQVTGADIDTKKVALISKDPSSIGDFGYNQRLQRVIDENKLKVTTDVPEAVESSDIIIIIVPTPITPEKEPDLSHIISASEYISKKLKKDQLIILESTTFPGTTEEIVKPILEKTELKAGEDFGLAYCPERYNPGDKEHTISNVSRIVGAITLEWADITKELYQTINNKEVVVVENIKTAEAAKIIENVQRDLNIALFNELAIIFQRMGIDIIAVIEAASTKWNFMKLYPGPGVGGHCLPVDPYYLTYKAKELGYDPQLILAGRSLNNYMPYFVMDLIIEGINELAVPIKESKIAILGISYKANTGDIRESPAISIINELAKMKANVYGHDPFVNTDIIDDNLPIKMCSLEDALTSADILVVHTFHDSFKNLDINSIKKLLKPEALLVDTQHVFSPAEVIQSGLRYKGIGRGGI